MTRALGDGEVEGAGGVQVAGNEDVGQSSRAKNSINYS